MPLKPSPIKDFSSEEKLARLRLIRSENVGPITFFKLIEQFGSAENAILALPELARKGGGAKAIRICAEGQAEMELAQLSKIGAVDVHLGEPNYPPRLAHIDDPPPILFVRGHLHLLTKRSVAVVGARNASTNGRRLAREIAAELGAAGYMVTSGMARGIDAAAHEGALPTGTAAVLGGGVDVVYPREHQPLYETLLDTGAVCSEIKIGTTPRAHHFPRRNRIISGMARGIIVVEAGQKSGSLITARMALEQGREVFAVPGNPRDPRAKGANALIRDGAHLLEIAADVIAAIATPTCCALNSSSRSVTNVIPPAPADSKEVAAARKVMLTALDYAPTDIDDLIRETGFSPQTVSLVLLELELAGRAERLPGNRASMLGT